jgi:hypothetical protein
MLCPPHSQAPLVKDWWERHRHPGSYLLHVVGIPPTIVGVLMIPVWLFGLSPAAFLFALSLFVGGYLVQFLGHAWDGTESGEWKAVKRRLRRLRGRIFGAEAEQGSSEPALTGTAR